MTNEIIRDFRRRLCSSEKKELLRRQSGLCFYCSIPLKSVHLGDNDDRNTDHQYACVDHKVSWINGGKTDLENCVMSCRKCNCEKGAGNYYG